jgi:hypothetical protein
MQLRYSAHLALTALTVKLQQASQILSNCASAHEALELCQLISACAASIQSVQQLL